MDDTIFGLSSGALPSAIAIIRVSGPRAGEVIRAFTGSCPEPGRTSLQDIRNPVTGELLDRGLILYFAGPASATGEDIAELHLHGSRAVVRSVESAMSNMEGLRPAQAGEFTRRGLINGKLDLNEAEGLADLLAAESESARRWAIQMADGDFSRAVERWRVTLLQFSARIEAALDFSDEGDVESSGEDIVLGPELEDLLDDVRRMSAMPSSERLRDGIRVVLAGPPNSGKSTLLNRLANREAAIVTDIAGTTRDLIEVPAELEGTAFLLTDTAGLRETAFDAVEQIGIERARQAIEHSDILLWLGPEGDGPAHPRLIEIAAKADLGYTKSGIDTVTLSALTGDGIGRLVERLCEVARDILPPTDGFALSRRQTQALTELTDLLEEAQASHNPLIQGEVLRAARANIDALVGRAGTEDMLDALFGRFCVGK